MHKAYFKLDAWVIAKIQDAYLWFLDRTGIYVATVGFTVYAVVGISEVLDGGTPWLWGLLLALVGLSLAPRYMMQDKCKNEQFNLIAMAMQDFRGRHLISMTIALIGLLEAVTLHPWSAMADFGFVLYGYLFLIMIRDRNKKPFFKPIENQEVAMHGAN